MIRILSMMLLLLAGSATAQPSFVKDSLETYIAKGMKLWNIPGVSVAIIKDGKIVHVKGYGVRDVVTRKPVDDKTLFMIGSNTKLFTATALTILEQEKKLSLDDKVSRWLPYFKLNDPLASDAITVRDLLCHRIGFETFQGDFTWWGSDLSRQDVVKHMSLIAAPYGFRTKWGYCNSAFVAAGEVVQAVSGQPWENFIRKSILQPLKMSDSKMLSGELRPSLNVATAYTVLDGKLVKQEYAKIDNLAPAGTMSSSAREMINWVQTQIDMGKFEGKQVIPEAAITATRQPQSVMGLDLRDKRSSHFYMYGLGVALKDRAGRVVVSHTGGVDGFLSSVTFIPEEKLGVIVLTNTDHNGFYQDLSNEIIDAYLDLPYVGYTYSSFQRGKSSDAEDKRKVDSLRSLVSSKNKPALALSSYAGDYVNKLYGDVSVRVDGAKLAIHFSHHPQLIGTLEFVNDNRFLCTYSNPTYGVKEIPFKVESGRVMGFRLTVADFVEFTPYDFTRK